VGGHMEKTNNRYRLTHEQLKKELKNERKKYTSKDKLLNIVCAMLSLIALALVIIYAATHGML
jgi:hypothetical protein